MAKDEEIIKEKRIRDKRIRILTVSGFTYLGAAIAISLFIPSVPLVTQVLVPLTTGVAVGVILSIISVKLSYATSIRLIEIQSTLEEMKDEFKDLDGGNQTK